MRNIRVRKLTASIALGAMLLTQTMWPIVAVGAAPVAKTPIQHVIIIVGENRTFDHLFGTYVPPKGQTVRNLLSEGIVRWNGQPGINAADANQYTADVTDTYSINPFLTDPYATLPQPKVGNPTTYGMQTTGQAPFANPFLAASIEPGLFLGDEWRLTLGGTGIPSGFDTRFPDPLDAHCAVLPDRGVDARAFGQIGDVDEPLTAVRIAIRG